MTTIKLAAHDQHLILLSQSVIASGDRNSVRLSVVTDAAWKGYTVTAAFFRDGERHLVLDVPLDTTGACAVPRQMLTEPCTLNIGIWGKNTDDQYKTSSLVRYRVVEGAPIEEGATLVNAADATASESTVLAGETFYAGNGATARTGNIRTYEEGDPVYLTPYVESDPTVPAWAKTLKKPTYTPAEVGAAPAGFGLGEYAKPLTSDVDLNTCLKGGWYSWRDSIPINAPDPWCMMEVIPFGSSEACLQRAYCIVFGQENLIRQRFMRGWGTWTEWEWVNPPMLLGVEYRTTERWLGKPVYAKAVDFGALPNNSTKNIKSIPALSTVVEISGTIFYESSSGAIVVQNVEKNGGISEVYISCDEGSVWIATNKDMTKYTAHVFIKYTKN